VASRRSVEVAGEEVPDHAMSGREARFAGLVETGAALRANEPFAHDHAARNEPFVMSENPQ
jgi:hypothetical protein